MENKREFYRLELLDKVEVLILHEEGKEKGYIKDISATGVGLEANYDFWFNDGIVMFKLDKKEFTRKAKLIRKIELKSGNYLYAVNFTDITEKERQFLFQTLLKLDTQKRLGNRK